MKLFVISSDITAQLAMDITDFFIKCKTEHENALILLNSAFSNINRMSQIIDSYQESGVHLTVIGMGNLSVCATALLCTADERILLPNTTVSFCYKLANYYTQKTKLTKRMLQNRCANMAPWYCSKDELVKYNITTKSSEGWMEIIMPTLGGNETEFVNLFKLTDEFNSETATKLVLFFVKCKKFHKKDARIFIHSPGGAGCQLEAILTAYQDSGIHLTVIGTGLVASCAAALFCTADERILTPNTEFMIHHPHVPLNPKSKKLPYFQALDVSLLLKEKNEFTVEALTKKTNIPRKVLNAKCKNDADWVLTENELQKYGVITRDAKGWMELLVSTT